ncbi:RNA polymerase factor sigma-32 [Desulfovibrio sp. OttesenSCG-928-F20]|nr:RNA polymerase factor sigma-32 [Desulfovibrio sp. OttesenSCG-928-F20]
MTKTKTPTGSTSRSSGRAPATRKKGKSRQEQAAPSRAEAELLDAEGDELEALSDEMPDPADSSDENLENDDLLIEGLDDETPENLAFPLDAVADAHVSDGALPAPLQKNGALTPFTQRPPEKTRDSLHLYLREINRFPLLQPDEEVELARRVRDNGDPDAAFRLVSSHLRLVVRIAMDFQRRWMQNVLDLVQEGNVGLVRAVSKFDPEKGIKFSYYATFWIKAYILKFIMDNWRLVKIGTTQTQRKLFYNLNKERQQLAAQGFTPDSAMLAERLNVSEEQIIEMEQRLDASDMSLDAPVSDEDASGASRMDYLPALGPGIEETLGNSEVSHLVHERLESLVPQLNDKEQYILEHRLLSEEPITLREIGDIFNITRERVRQIEARLLQKVRDHLFKNIKDFSRDWIEQ